MTILIIIMAAFLLWGIVASLKSYLNRRTKSSLMEEGLKAWAQGDYSKRDLCVRILRADLPTSIVTFCARALDGDKTLGLYATTLTGSSKIPDNMTRLSGGKGVTEMDIFFGHRLSTSLGTHDDTKLSVPIGEAVFSVNREQKDPTSGKTKTVVSAIHRYNSSTLPYLDTLLGVLTDQATRPKDTTRDYYASELLHMVKQHPEEAPRYAEDPLIGGAVRKILESGPV